MSWGSSKYLGPREQNNVPQCHNQVLLWQGRIKHKPASTSLGLGPAFLSVQTAMGRRRQDGTAPEVTLPVFPAPDQKSLIFQSQQLFQICTSVHNCITRCMLQEAKANSSQHHPKAHQRSFMINSLLWVGTPCFLGKEDTSPLVQ